MIIVNMIYVLNRCWWNIAVKISEFKLHLVDSEASNAMEIFSTSTWQSNYFVWNIFYGLNVGWCHVNYLDNCALVDCAHGWMWHTWANSQLIHLTLQPMHPATSSHCYILCVSMSFNGKCLNVTITLCHKSSIALQGLRWDTMIYVCTVYVLYMIQIAIWKYCKLKYTNLFCCIIFITKWHGTFNI